MGKNWLEMTLIKSGLYYSYCCKMKCPGKERCGEKINLGCKQHEARKK